MNKNRRQVRVVVAAAAIGAFVAPATVAQALWSTIATATVDVTTAGPQGPIVPSGMSCVSQVKQVSATVSWTATSDVTYSLMNAGVATLAGLDADDLPVTVTPDQMGGNNVTLHVRATNATGQHSTSSQTFQIQFNAPSCAVTP